MDSFNFKSLAKLLAFVIFSWILVHVAAVLGIFVACAFPILCLLWPPSAFCFFCRVRPIGGYCPVCRLTITENTPRYPKSLFSIFGNTLVLLLITFFSLAVVKVESIVLQQVLPLSASVAFNIPSQSSHLTKEIFPLELELITKNIAVNTVQSDIHFNPKRLKIIDIKTKDSFATIFIQKEINNEIGFIRLTGGLPSPGFKGEKGVFATVYFQAISPGITEVDFLPTSMVLANDGAGTNILDKPAPITYLILPEEISKDKEQVQRDFFESKVLGVNSEQELKKEKSQMIFYENTDVLGAEQIVPVQEAPIVKKISIGTQALMSLQKIDEQIIHFFSRITTLFQQK